MSLPDDHEIQFALMHLLETQPDGRLHCTDVYRLLEEQFPQLTVDETNLPYRNSRSHFANRAQFAVLHLRRERWLLSPCLSGRGYWELSRKGRDEKSRRFPTGDELLRELS